MRNDASTTYTGAIETADPFGRRIHREAWDRGWDRAKTKVVFGDLSNAGGRVTAQEFATDTLIIGESEPSVSDVLSKNPVLLDQVINRLLLVLVQPACDKVMTTENA